MHLASWETLKVVIEDLKHKGKKKSKQRPQMQGKRIKIKWSHGYKSFNKRNRDGSSWNGGEEGS